ncbi:hypothetical protein AMTR_s00087p00080760 [Amborella trichopoda]|uniref:Uncharacterized protein n=1 Tax=Amborella trichopoda TaxID=13333 RepID=W1P4R4_AMBTC|nr:hypothetical protein AMTR_s00087p00080760 [Amborella trichopoda]
MLPLVVVSSSSLPSSISCTLSNKKASSAENFLWASLQGLKRCYLSNLEVEIITVRDFAATLRGDSFKNEDTACLANIKVTEEELEKLQAYLNRLKTRLDRKRAEAQSKSQELEKLNSEMASTNIASTQITQVIANLKALENF